MEVVKLQNRLKELRKEKNLSQKELAKTFNEFIENNKEYAILDYKGKIKKISYATISRWEVGQTPIPTKYYEALANFFNVPLAYIQGAGYSKKEIEEIILYEINYKLANSFISGEKDERLAIALYDFLCINNANLKIYLSLCGDSVIERHQAPTLNIELVNFLKKVYSFFFEDEFILSLDKNKLCDKKELDAILYYLVRSELNKINESRLTMLGKWFEDSFYLENTNSKNLNEADKKLKHAKILNKRMESNLHDSVLNDFRYSTDSEKILNSLEMYQGFIQYLISEVKSKMNSLAAESKKEDKNQQ